MKKYFNIFLLLTVMFALVSCTNYYTYKFVNDDGSVIVSKSGMPGIEIVAPEDPVKESTDEFDYEFIGWDKEVGTLDENIVFTAQYRAIKRSYTYKFVNYNNDVLKEEKIEYGTLPIAPSTNPVKEPDAEGTYEFIGWDKEIETITCDVVYVAQYKIVKNEYTYKFVNFDGSILKEAKGEQGTLPIAPTITPQKSSTKEHTYRFIGWDKEIVELTGDVTYTAQFEELTREYICRFVNFDGSLIEKQKVAYGSKPTLPEQDPVRPKDAEFTYAFAGWDKEIEVVTSDVIFTATYTKTKNSYTYKFVDFDGTILKEETVEYGTIPIAPSEPTRSEDEKATYTFDGWDKEITAIYGDVIYTATYAIKLKINKFSELSGKKISILGDSISTFYAPGSPMNSYYSEEGRYYYPRYCQDVKTVEKTWWGQLINNTKMVLGINNSWSGSTAVGNKVGNGCSDERINTLVENGNPDIVILYLGTNDVCAGYSAETFIEAYEIILSKIYNLCTAQVYVCTLGYSAYTGMKYTDKNRISYNEAIRAFANKHNLCVIPLDEYVMEDNYKLYLNDFLHYKYKGTTLLSQICEKSLCEYNDIEYTKKIEVEHPVPEPKGHIVIGAYNQGVWDTNVYPNNVLLYSYDTLLPGSTYAYYYIVRITKDGDNYRVTGKKDINASETFDKCDYYIMINSTYPSSKFFSDVNVGDMLKLTGDITSGKCEFALIE